MRITIKAKPSSYEERVDPPSPGGFSEIGKDYFTVWVKEPPVHGLANKAIIKALADYFKTSPSRIRIVSGYTSRQKVVEIL
ncbi:MAG: hypothetical protein A2655_01370 [Candidatus Yanofskybacteria bacterium RIFCSPHIGHO2_01_FULL_43_42]|uniref:Uncharacterized protein n=1 Tax=Candidatus Yanofskybacteria bacterium RIFCSPLOWO2_01_FULL_43_22 TaxID=1802695 RepID=A0A1F8GGM6_9BACT|nr:MAG: hypothetical protein A2655_01370 [Candidatus Yanofskybacteria bacterium RIFCSPHIGHO2_01_FULL_43_42]OGN13134.1 MAG: hypothetical protein A3D48_02285 [Candidatus Yanofskybacteria bacterium RIFCSPHIGHO2_02_FULL_43_17]OGN24547.1 MAG: hypothetical protein A3A13_00500 [Candidatus Yanofskybacteria bacterium RIFCSPLOWO2_01_FULL_43_22]